ncbi:MAG: VCBS domain-containing protein [Methylobacter sp.]|nr:VCBS domain-containing protein [Methylobacter sp.]MDP2098140.1 VCBS domain-containing protein [Methylobacter sp.]MDP2427430.1 VCBS domain-containing protein [Methylobacter sp.]MDP3056002.1 VCBS domain-containing protein [Methylobacter sp.]MDP3363313.1 VCBS domain-containing protein [Methylobacter sp.]
MLKKITPLLLLLLCSFELFAAPLRIKPQANDDYASVTVGVRPSVSINLSTNDRYGSFFYINGSTYGEYGFLELAGNAIVNSSDPTFGAFYTYTLYENDTNANLAPGQVVTDTFTYTYANDVGQSSDARIIIQVTGNQRVPVAVDDYASVVVGITPTASGNLASNDRNGNIVTINGSSAGHYGVLELIGNTGIYTYTLYDNDTNSNLATGQTYQDIFTYTYINNLGQSATARLIVNVTRNQQPPIATPDFASVIVGVTPGAAGNLSTNDRNGSIITLDATTPGAGKYGFLALSGTGGQYIYTLYNQLPDVDLTDGKTVNDIFTYIYANDLGQSVKSTLTVTISSGPRQSPVAVDDFASVVVDVRPTASGNLGDNDRYGSIITLIGSPSGKYGFLQLNGTSGAYVYILNANIVDADLAAGRTVTDVFTYDYANEFGQKSAPAKLTVNITSNQLNTEAVADSVTLVPNTVRNIVSIAGNVSTNDRNGGSVSLAPAPIPENPKNPRNLPSGEFGTLVLNADGSFVYTLNVGATNVIALTAGQVVYDTFTYVTTNQFGQSASANLTVTIIGNPVDSNGNTIFEPPVDEPLDNVDIEFNNRSIDATPLNSGRNIKGSLYDSEDKDWFVLDTISTDQDQVIKLDLCPVGSSCYGKKSWVVYVFDGDRLTAANLDPLDPLAPNPLTMESQSYTFRRWVDETGNSTDVLGNDILGTGNTVGTSNHMYLAYQQGFFQNRTNPDDDGALIGVIDPCFDNLSTLDIGVGKSLNPDSPKPSRYYIAVSSTLMGSDNGVPAGQCGVGTVVLRRPAFSAAGLDAEGKAKSYTTTEEYISAFPFSDDQYTINITGVAINPLDSTTAGRSATFNSTTGVLNIPRVRIAETLYSADLTLQPQSTGRSANTDANLKFALTGIEGLAPEQIVDAFRATYNRINQQLMIPRVTDTVTGNSYSVVMQYHQETDGNPVWLEVIDYVLIQ